MMMNVALLGIQSVIKLANILLPSHVEQALLKGSKAVKSS